MYISLKTKMYIKNRQDLIYNKCYSACTVFVLRCLKGNKSFYSALRIKYQTNQKTVRIVQIFDNMLRAARFAQ